jgi:DNA-binding winged helix-turn-helix (wHTH) protein/TolB-like protein
MQQDALVVGSVVYDRRRGELSRLDGGSPVPIRPQSIRVLDLLIDHVGQLVNRDTIHAAVWPGTIVTDDSLVQCIAEIRRAIGDTQHEIVCTVPRRGYRLEAFVPHSTTGPAPAVAGPPRVARRRRTVVALVAAAMLAAVALGWRMTGAPTRGIIAAPDVIRPPLAVMAFRAESAEAGMDALGAGWAEDLAASLARDADLRLVATRSSFAVSQTAGPEAVAKQLGVRYLVDGRVRQVDDVLQVTAQLIDGHDGTIVWTERLDLTKTNFAVEREGLVRKVAASVQASMRWREKGLARQLPTTMDAQVLTLRAYGNKHQYAPEAYRSARVDLEQSLRLAPDYAAAWAGLGYLNGIDAINRITGEWTMERLPVALEQIDRALSLDPALSVGFQARAIVLGAMRRQSESLGAAEEAVRIAPGDPDNLLVLAKSQVEAGRVADGLASVRRALVLYPIEPVYVSFIAAHVFWAGGLQAEATAAARRCVERAPRFTNCRVTLASALVESGGLDEAREQAREIRALVPDSSSLAFSNLFDGVPELRSRRIAVADALGFPRAR